MKVAFAGTPEFAARALQAIAAAGFDVPLVLTQPDRPAGRGQRLQASAVKELALEHGWPVQQPRGLRLDGRFADDAAGARATLSAAAPDVVVVAAYGVILPPWLLELPRQGCINIHASLLPRWRGAAPIQRAIEAGDTRTGITIMQMDAGLDTGPMLLAESLDIANDETSATLHDKLASMGGRLVVKALVELQANHLTAIPQPPAGATYARKIEKIEGVIDWSLPAAVIERRVRAFDPAPGSTFVWRGETVKLWRAAVHEHLRGTPGEPVSLGPHRLALACGAGALEVLEVQRPGGRRVPASALLA